MRRLSIARSLQLALLGLTVALTAIAAFGVASMTIAPSRSSSAWVTVPLSSVCRCSDRSWNPNASVSQSIAAPASS